MSDLTKEELLVNQRFIEAFELLGFPEMKGGITKFCNSIGLSPSIFPKIKSNERLVSKHYLTNLASVHGINIDWLKTGAGIPTATNTVSGNKIKGSGNALGINSQAGAVDLQAENERLKMENDHLKQRLKDKEEMIELLKKK